MIIKKFVPDFLVPVARPMYQRILAEYDRRLYERPSTSYRRNIAAAATLPHFLEYAKTLCTNGTVVVPKFFDPERVSEMCAEFERLVATNPPNLQAQTQNSVHISTSRFQETKLFSQLLFEPDMLRLVQYYWGQPVVLNGTGGTRYESAEMGDYGSNQWHHDGKRKQVRVFIFLTDVPEDGQCTKYIAGSHKKYHYDLRNSRLDETVILQESSPTCCTGPAGSLAIIDTNGAHRANRNTGPRRDTWNFAFRAPGPLSTKLNPVPVLHPTVAKHLTSAQLRIARLT